ncbi:hypothetical protein ACFWBN_00410 [Streptomyces sp. NPDC059989]|uniref:hypothetical protein n=1 Tax=Streptomyces sp. NPDC059989 TaxID=3347026 RepID=UPI003681D9C4
MVVSVVGCGLAMLAAASCTTAPAPPLAPRPLPPPSLSPEPLPLPLPTATPTPPPAPAPSPTAPDAPSTSGPAGAVGDAKPTAADRALLELVRQDPAVHVPGDDEVIVIRREPDGRAGELAWMPDDRHYCLAVVREARAETACGSLPTFWTRVGIRLVAKGRPYPDPAGGGLTRTVFFAVVDGGHGPYAYSGTGTPTPGLSPVRDATAAFASGRTLSLLTYDRPVAGRAAADTYICGADNAICFPSTEALPLPSSPSASER